MTYCWILIMFYCWKILVLFAFSDECICFCLNNWLHPSWIILFEVGCLFICWFYIYIYNIYIYTYNIHIYIYIYIPFSKNIASSIRKSLWTVFSIISVPTMPHDINKKIFSIFLKRTRLSKRCKRSKRLSNFVQQKNSKQRLIHCPLCLAQHNSETKCHLKMKLCTDAYLYWTLCLK